MLGVRVQDGTGAGRKRPLRDPKPDWRCVCGHANRGYHVRCMRVGCNRRRDG